MNDTATHRLQVSGMSCQHCVRAITQAIQARDADALVDVDLRAGVVEIRGSARPLDAIRQTIEEEGYAVTA